MTIFSYDLVLSLRSTQLKKIINFLIHYVAYDVTIIGHNERAFKTKLSDNITIGDI